MDFEDEDGSKGLDLPRLFAAVSVRRRWIWLPTLAAFLGAAAFVTLVKPRYTATAKVMLENGDSYYTRPEHAQPAGADAVIDDLTVESEAEAAKSPDVERVALAKLEPEDRAEFAGDGGLLARLMGRGESEDQRLEAFSRQAEIYPQAKTRVLLFDFTSQNAARAARAADALAEAFLDSQRAAKDEEAKSASKWLSGEIDALRAKVATAEGQIEALRAKSGLLAGANGMAVPSQQLSEIAAQIASARAAEAAATAKAAAWRDLMRDGRLDEVASVAGDESLRRYAEARVALKAQMAELGRTMLPGHPRMKELAGQLAGLDSEIRDAATKRVRGFEEDGRIAAAQVKTLNAAVSDQAKTVTSTDADAVRLRELEIDAKTARDQLESYLTKYREAIARDADDAAPANGRIIARALTPASPSFPKTGATLLLAPLAAFCVSLGLVVASILIGEDGRASAPAAAPRREPELPFGIDPATAGERPEAEAVGDWAALESFVDRLAETGEGETLPVLVTGSDRALPAALAAGRRLSRRGRAALVDLGVSPAWLSDVLDRSALADLTFGDLVAHPDEAGRAAPRDLSSELDIFPSGAGQVAIEHLPAAFEALSRRYDFLVVHAPDWRDDPCVAAARDMAAMLVVAPAEALASVEAEARAAYREEGLAIKAIAAGPLPDARERAA